MSNQGAFLVGLLTGAGLMYLLDPDRGSGRRALIRDRAARRIPGLHGAGASAAGRARDMRGRAVDALQATRARLRPTQVDDPVLEASVRSGLARLTAAAGRIEVSADHGRVVLTGQAPAADAERIVAGVRSVPGVREVVNRLAAAPESSGSAEARETSR